MIEKNLTRKELKKMFWIKDAWSIDLIKEYFDTPEAAQDVFTRLFFIIEENRQHEKGLRARDKALIKSLDKLTRKQYKLNLDPYYIGRAPVKWIKVKCLISDMIKINKDYMNLSKPDLSKFLWTNFQTNMTPGAILRFIQQELKDQKDNN